MNALNRMLAQQRQAIRARKKRQRVETQRQAEAAGLPVDMTAAENLERLGAAWTADDFRADLDRLLIARDAGLYIVWQGKKGQLYVDSPEGKEVLQEAHRQKRTLRLCMNGDMGKRIGFFLDKHKVEIAIGWVSGKLVLQCGSREVSDIHCLRLIEVDQGKRRRYMMKVEEQKHDEQGKSDQGSGSEARTADDEGDQGCCAAERHAGGARQADAVGGDDGAARLPGDEG